MEMIEKKYYTVNSLETLKLLVEHINASEIIAFDTEGTGVNTRHDHVIGFSVCGEIGTSFYFPFLAWNHAKEQLEELQIEGQGAKGLALRVLNKLKGKKLVMHNGAYDTSIVLNDLKIDLLPSLYCDTIMLIHTVQEEGVGRGGVETFGLKKVAVAIQDKLGLDVERAANEEQIELKESIIRNGGKVTKAEYEIYKADLEILSKYGAADTDLTLRVFYYFSEILKKEQLEQFFYVDEVMPLYREVTIPMERAGIDLDIPLLESTKADIEKDMEKYKADVINYLLKDEPGKRWVIETALKNFPPKKGGAWGKSFIERHSLPLPKTSRGYSTAKAAVLALDLSPEDEWQRQFLLTGDASYVPQEEQIRISLALWKDLNHGDYFNIQSADQLSEILFDYYGEEPPKIERRDTGEEKTRESFDGWVIQALSKKYDWVESLRIYRKLQKIYTTYIMRFLTQREEDDKFYAYFKQNGTVSGRYASNLQQLPHPMEEYQDVEVVRHYNHLVRQFLIAGKGYKFVDADYESLEPHCFASVSGDEGLREIFRKGWDFYSTIAIRTEKLDQDKKRFPNGVSADKKSDIFLKKLSPTARQKAKGYSLGVPYGMTAYALGKSIKVPTKEAQVLIDGYLDGYPDLKQWYNGSREFTYKNGYIRNLTGRIRHLPKVKEIYEAFGEQILDSSFRRELAKKLEYSGMTAAEAEKEVLMVLMDFKNGRNNCLNFQIQSLGASVVNRAALAITRKAKELGIEAVCVAQIHDQVVFRVREDQAEEFKPWMEKLMAETTKLPGIDLAAPAEIGDNMYETHG